MDFGFGNRQEQDREGGMKRTNADSRTRGDRFRRKVMERIDLSRELEDDELRELIHQVLLDRTEEEYLPLAEKIQLSRELFNAFRKLDLLQDLLVENEVSEMRVLDRLWHNTPPSKQKMICTMLQALLEEPSSAQLA